MLLYIVTQVIRCEYNMMVPIIVYIDTVHKYMENIMYISFQFTI